MTEPEVAQQEQPDRRVLFVEFATHFGGAVLSLADLIQGLKSLPVEPHVLAFQQPDLVRGLFPGTPVVVRRRLTNHLTRIAFRNFIETKKVLRPFKAVLMKLYAAFDYLYGFYFTFLILWLIRRHRIDILHTNNGLNVNGLRAAAWAGIPCVAHVRARVTRNTSDILRKSHRHVEKSLRRAIAVSEFVRRTGIEKGIPEDKIVTIHNPISLPAYDQAKSLGGEVRRRHGIGPDRTVVGNFGRVIPFKGQVEFLQAAAEISQDCPELTFLIVGDEADGKHPEYWSRVQEIGNDPPLEGRVVFCGYRQDVAAYYHACDIVVHSAIKPEGFGRVLVEAMACSKPVVASAEGGPLDIVTHGEDGILVPPGSVPALAAAMKGLARSKEERDRLGRAGRKKVENHFSAPALARQVSDLYKKID